MAKFHGEIGYGVMLEKPPGSGVYVETIIEYVYSGDVLRNTRSLTKGPSVNSDIAVANSISILADAYAREHFFAMRYVRWQGALWTIDEVEVVRPRLLLRLGGVYNGPTPGAPEAS